MHNGVLFSLKKGETLSYAVTDRITGYHIKCSKSDTERQILCDLTHAWNLKINTTEVQSRMVINKIWGEYRGERMGKG